MIKRKEKESLADKIAGLLTSAPATFDPEDVHVDDTSAKLQSDVFDDDDNNDEEELLSKFRKQNIDLLEDVDERYAGKKRSRKDLKDSDSDTASEYSDNQESGNEEEHEAASESDNNESNVQTDENDSENDSEVEESDEEEENESSDGEDVDLEEENAADSKEDNFKHLKTNDVSLQVKKGLCVRNQMSMWESLLEMRIQLQKCLITANKLPQKDAFKEIKKQSTSDFSKKVTETRNSISEVLEKMLLLQKLVLKKYPETKSLDGKKKKSDLEGSEEEDEEIPSDTEESNDELNESEEENAVPKKKRKLNDYEKDINDRHVEYQSYRNGVIQKWHDKTKIAIMKNNAASHSIINHIEHTLSDKSKLIKRTQLKRSEYEILGQNSSKIEPAEENEENPERRIAEEFNTEIFDDDDFYHQLLRELIEVKSADLTDPVQLGRQWIQLQNLRSKMKRKIDTKATKGRKIRYTVHTKLVNYMAPIDSTTWTDEAKTELYNSLFGKNNSVTA